MVWDGEGGRRYFRGQNGRHEMHILIITYFFGRVTQIFSENAQPLTVVIYLEVFGIDVGATDGSAEDCPQQTVAFDGKNGAASVSH